MKMSSPRRLHPVAALLSFIRMLKDMLGPILLFFFLGTGKDDRFIAYYYMGAIVILVGLLFYGVLSWLRYTYWIEQEELRIEYGILIRKKRYIPKERIQSIDFTEGILQRVFGLVKVQVQTAGGGADAEAVLTAVTRADAGMLRAALTEHSEALHQIGDPESEGEHIPRVERQFKLPTRHLLIAASTSGTIGVVLSAFAAFSSQFDELIPDSFYEQIFNEIVGLGTVIQIGLAIAALIIAWILGMAGTVIKYANFTLTKKGEELHISRGLIERRQMTIPLKRIQAVRISESLLRQPLGFATLYIESAGGVLEKNEELSTVLFPLMKSSDIADFLNEVAPEFAIEPEWKPLPQRALRRFLFRAGWPIVALATLLSVFLWPWGLWSFLLLLPALGIGYWRWRDSAWSMIDDTLLIRTRLMSRSTVIVPKRRIQAALVQQTFFQKRVKVATWAVWVITNFNGREFAIRDIDTRDGDTLTNWFSKEEAIQEAGTDKKTETTSG